MNNNKNGNNWLIKSLIRLLETSKQNLTILMQATPLAFCQYVFFVNFLHHFWSKSLIFLMHIFFRDCEREKVRVKVEHSAWAVKNI